MRRASAAMAGLIFWLGCAPRPAARQEIRFTGTIEAINVGCWSDGVCSMRISGKDIVFGRGWSRETYGELTGFEQGKLPGGAYVGREAEVFGWKDQDGVNISGDRKYYIKLLELR